MSDSRGKSLAKNTLILTIGKISTQAITFLLLPLYTAYLSREDYGVVDLISTIVALLIPILNVQIEQAVFRYMVVDRQNKEELKRIISSAFSFIFCQIILVAGLFFILHPFVHNQYKWFLLINLVVGILIAIINKIGVKKGKEKRNEEFSCAGCPSAALCKKTSCSDMTEITSHISDTEANQNSAEEEDK